MDYHSGYLLETPSPNTYYWVMGFPTNKKFMKPTKLRFLHTIFRNDPNYSRPIPRNMIYSYSMMFENEIEIPVYNFKTHIGGQHITPEYYIRRTTGELFTIIKRMIDGSLTVGYDEKMLREYYKFVSENNPEHLI